MEKPANSSKTKVHSFPSLVTGLKGTEINAGEAFYKHAAFVPTPVTIYCMDIHVCNSYYSGPLHILHAAWPALYQGSSPLHIFRMSKYPFARLCAAMLSGVSKARIYCDSQ